MRVLHLTPHLGGGVGRALSGLVSHSGAAVAHTIACLEAPEKSQFVDRIRRDGGMVEVCPGERRLRELVGDADVVQLEWWHHPATLECLCRSALPPARWLVWSHVSGLHTPIIPRGLISAAHRFVFTSPCSLQDESVAELARTMGERLGVVASCGGFEGLPMPQERTGGELAAGYMGSQNFAKLHPRYAEFAASVGRAGFRIRMIGDLTNREELERQSAMLGKPGLFEFSGYVMDVAQELASVNVLAYLLNPEHYGTTENALLEAMAMGIVPVVLDNPVELEIVRDRVTGLVVRTPDEFAEAIGWLADNPGERAALGARAASSVRERYSAQAMAAALEAHYHAMMAEENRQIDFAAIFGDDAAQWFLSCQGDSGIFGSDGRITLAPGEKLGHGLLERTKGSVFHFRAHFPDDPRLAQWAGNLERL